MWDAFKLHNLKVTVMESIVTAGAAITAVLIGMEIWTMFVGWIAYFTRELGFRNGLVNLGCVVIGLVLGAGAATTLGTLGGQPSVAAQAAVVLGVALIVLSLRFLPIFNNLLGLFLGLITWFAAHEPASPGALGTLAFGGLSRQRCGLGRASPPGPHPGVHTRGVGRTPSNRKKGTRP